MKRSTRVWIGAAAAAVTFASLFATVGMRYRHHYGMGRHGYWGHQRHCEAACYGGGHERQTPAPGPLPGAEKDTHHLSK